MAIFTTVRYVKALMLFESKWSSLCRLVNRIIIYNMALFKKKNREINLRNSRSLFPKFTLLQRMILEVNLSDVLKTDGGN